MFSYSVEPLAEALGIGYTVLIYAVGLIAMMFSTVAVQFRHRVTIILSNFIGQSCWVAYFLLQGDLTSAVACALSAVMLAVFAKKDKWKWATGHVSIAVFLVLICGFSLLSFRTWIDLFPLLAGVFAVLANSREDEKSLRRLTLFWCVFWLLNSTFKMYPVAFVNDLFCTASTVIALIRYREKRRH